MPTIELRRSSCLLRVRVWIWFCAVACLVVAPVEVTAQDSTDVATGEYFRDRVLVLPAFPFELKVTLRGQDELLRVTAPLERPSVRYTAPAGAGDAPSARGYWIVGPKAWEAALGTFVRGQRALGWNAEYVSIESIRSAYGEFTDDADALRAVLKDAYARGATYALLVGDASVLPVRYASDLRTDGMPALDQLQICDLYFGEFDGDWDVDGDGVYGEPIDDSADLAAELLVGRLPVSRADEAAVWCAKWDRYVFARGDLSYLGRALGLTSDQMRDDADGTGQAALVARFWPAGIAHDSVSMLERPSGAALESEGPWASEVLDTWGAGWGIVQLFVHGRWDGFALKTAAYNTWPKSYLLTDPAASGAHGWLGNLRGSPGIVYSVACNQAAFDAEAALGGPAGQPCVATLLLASPDGGAAAFIGYSRWGWVYTSYHVARAFWEGVFDSASTAAAALQMAKLRFPYFLDVAYGHNLYGDPALRIWRGIPVRIVGTAPKFVSAAGGSITVSADAEGQRVAATVTILADDGALLFVGATDSTGRCTISLGALPPQSLLVTISAPGYAPFQDTIIVSIASDVSDEELLLQQFALANYPNPFNARTCLRIESAGTGYGRLRLYNQLGQEVRAWDLSMVGGATTVMWDGTDDAGRALPSGVYFARLGNVSFTATRKLMMLK